MKLKVEYIPIDSIKPYENNAKYEVYMHIFPNNKVYIGITSYGSENRWHSGYGYKKQQMMWRSIQKYGWNNIEHKILFKNLTEKQAKEKEIELIKKYKSDERKYGYNIRHGGDICSGYKLSEETCKKMSKSRTGENNWIYGKHLTEETKNKLSKAHMGKCDVEAVKKGAKKRMGKNAYNSRMVTQYDKNKIKTYDSLADAHRETNTRVQDIYNCCKGRQKTANKFIWEYAS